jgi:hypothetical protein
MARNFIFPPRMDCPLCLKPLRPATRAEINRDLKDPKYAHIAESAAQGSMGWEPPADWSDWEKATTPPGSWLFRCDTCNHRALWLRDESDVIS